MVGEGVTCWSLIPTILGPVLLISTEMVLMSFASVLRCGQHLELMRVC
jgi:hypothetical protein